MPRAARPGAPRFHSSSQRRARLIPAAVFGGTLSVTIVLIVIPMPVAGALVAALPADRLPALLLTCSAAQALAMALALRGLWRYRASYTASHTPAQQTAATKPSPAALTARDAA